MERKLNTTRPRLSVGNVVPNFTLKDLNDEPISRGAYRVLRHLVLVLLPNISAATQTYIEELRDSYATIHAAEGEVLVLIGEPVAQAAEVYAELDTPFHILIDSEKAVSAKFLPEGAGYGIFILDRYGALHAQWVLSAPPFPPVEDVVEWIEAIDNQCTL
ncbi:MAG: redoxin domain-containing protein [Oscillochloris sp.]|nr:redoxin domain-containing protein [Oscillochloris sp.]